MNLPSILANAVANDSAAIRQGPVTALPLRIGILMDHPSPHMIGLLNALAARDDCVVEVIYCCQSAPERRWGAPVGKLPHRFLRGIRLRNGFRFNPGIVAALGGVDADTWILNSVYASATTLIAAWWLKHKGLPIAFMNEPVRNRGRIFGMLKSLPLRFVLDRSDAILTTGQKAAERYRELVPDGKIVDCVPYYLDLSDFFRLPLPDSAVRNRIIDFVSCGRITRMKGIEVLLQACTLLPAGGWRLTIAGGGESRRRLELEFGKRWPREQVRFLGEIPFANRISIFAGKHVFVHPSLWDGWGMVIPEALAAGLPVVCTDRVISALEFVRNGENGFTVPANDPEALASKMSWFLENDSMIPGMGQAARNSLREYRPELGAERLVRCASRIARRPLPCFRDHSTTPAGSPVTWSQLTGSASLPGQALRLGRSHARSFIINASIALKRGCSANGNRILAYHLVLPEDKQRFCDQVRFLADHFELCSLAGLVEGNKLNGTDLRYRLTLTFDDGFRVLMQDCLAILQKFGIKASFFVPTGYIERCEQPTQAALFSRRAHPHLRLPLEPMRPSDLKLLVDLGHEVGSHGVTHTSMRALSESMAHRELTLSRERIREWTGVEPKGFAFPYGHTTSSILDPAGCARSAGYEFGLTLRRGKVQESCDSMLLPRDHFEGCWPVRHLRHFLFS